MTCATGCSTWASTSTVRDPLDLRYATCVAPLTAHTAAGSLFEEAEIDGVNLLSLTEEELVPVGVPDPGHRAVILRAIDQRNLQS